MQSIKGSRVLVSGGAGFVGSHLVRRLISEQAKVFVLARRGASTWRLSDVLPQVEFCYGDIVDEKSVLECAKASRPDFILNLAAMRKVDRNIRMLDSSVDINLLGVLNLFKAAEELNLRPRAFVQTGSLEEYGAGPVPYVEGQREEPVSPYTASKVAATQFCQMLYRSLNYPVVVLRPCLMYGPFQAADMFIPMLIEACLKNKDFPMTSGEQTRDLGYVSDIIEAYLLAVKRPEAIGEVINIGSGREYKIKEVAKKIVKLTGSKTRLQFGGIPERAAEIERLVCDNSKAKTLLGWSPKIDIDAGLIQTIEWFRLRMPENEHSKD